MVDRRLKKKKKRSTRPRKTGRHSRHDPTPPLQRVPAAAVATVLLVAAAVATVLLVAAAIPSPSTRWQRASAASVAQCAAEPASLVAATTRHYAAARKLLLDALPDDAAPALNTTLRDAFIRAAVVDGVVAVDHTPAIHAAFARVWKAGNEAVRLNVAAAYGPLTQYDDVPPAATVPPNATCYFTFVRAPGPRLLSAYNEVEYRMAGGDPGDGDRYAGALAATEARTGPLAHTRYAVGSADRVRAFFLDLVDGRLLANDEASHLFPQIAFVARAVPRLDYIGRVERLASSDWRGWQRACVARRHGWLRRWPAARFDASLQRHRSSDDPLGTYGVARQLAATDATFQRVVCHVSAVDLACWHLPVPAECVAVVKEQGSQNW